MTTSLQQGYKGDLQKCAVNDTKISLMTTQLIKLCVTWSGQRIVIDLSIEEGKQFQRTIWNCDYKN